MFGRIAGNPPAISPVPEAFASASAAGASAPAALAPAESAAVSVGVDRSSGLLKVTADDAVTALIAVREATGFKHIHTVRIEECNAENFPDVVAALTALPLSEIDLHITLEDWTSDPLTEHGLSLLARLAPASVHLFDSHGFTVGEAAVLASLSYPVSVSVSGVSRQERHVLLALAAIPNLVSLAHCVVGLDDDVAEALGKHRQLTRLTLFSEGGDYSVGQGIVITDRALARLATSRSLETLDISIDARQSTVGSDGLMALAGNRTLEQLRLNMSPEPFGPPIAQIMASNVTLKTLEIGFSGGYGYLAGMRGLQHLKSSHVGATITLSDAHTLARSVHLASLDIRDAIFEAGALVVLLRSQVRDLTLHVQDLNVDEIQVLLENRFLRSLNLFLTSDFTQTVANTVALAAHASLDALSVTHVDQYGVWDQDAITMTAVEKAVLFRAWGADRPAAALTVNF